MDKVLGFLGLCKKAGVLETGEQSVGAASAKGKASLILTASDTAQGSLKRAENFARRAGTEIVSLPYTKDELGDILGRRVCAILALCDKKMAVSLLDKLQNINNTYADAYKRMTEKHPKRRIKEPDKQFESVK